MSNPVLTLAEITPEWLSRLLRCDVASVVTTPIGTGQVGATYRLTLAYTGQRGDAPQTLIAKLPSNDSQSRAAALAHKNYLHESRFYQIFAGKKPMAVPEHLYIAFDEGSHNFTLVMHDLPQHRAGNQLAEPSKAEAMLAMEAAASIHAAWWGDPMLDTLDWPQGTLAVPPSVDFDALYATFWPAYCDRYTDRVSDRIRQVGEAFLGRLVTARNSYQSPRCLTHNDFRADNMLFCADDRERPIVIVDWQTTGVGVGAADVGYYIGTSFDGENRRVLEAELIAGYRRGLAERGIPDGELVALEDDVYRCAVNGLLMSVFASMIVQRTDRGDEMFLAMARRSAAMVFENPERAFPV